MLLRTGPSPRRSGFGHAGGTVRSPAVAVSSAHRLQCEDYECLRLNFWIVPLRRRTLDCAVARYSILAVES